MAKLGEAVDRLLALDPLPNPQREHPRPPKGWEPGLAWDGIKGTLTTKPLAKRPDTWDELLKVWGLDPEKYEVVEPVQYRAWDANVGEGNIKRLYYYKATIIERRAGSREDVDALIARVRKEKPRRSMAPSYGESGHTFAVFIADPQLGKDDGDGTAGTVLRIENAIDRIGERLKELRKIGRPIGQMNTSFMGDLFENCSGFYQQQAFRVELNHRDQLKLGRRLFKGLIDYGASLVEREIVATVGGNHGERRIDGKSYTDFADNDDVAVIEQLAEVFAANPERYGNISFVIPNNELSIALDMAGSIVGLAHGHQFPNKESVSKKAREWWKGQEHGRQPVGEADILVTAHHHFPWMDRSGVKTIFGCPALDGGSEWFTNRTGQDTPAGVLTMVIGPQGWQDLAIL